MIIMPKMKVLYRASRAIRRYPEHHSQGTWHETADGRSTVVLADNDQAPACGTTLCEAGWIAFQNAPAGARLAGNQIRFADGTFEQIEEFARKAAGLTQGQADALFYGASTADDLDAMVDELERNPEADRSDLVLAAGAARRAAA